MTRWQLLTLFGIIGIILAGVYFWPVRAQDVPPCVDADELIAALKSKDGAVELGSVEVESRYGDQVAHYRVERFRWDHRHQPGLRHVR